MRLIPMPLLLMLVVAAAGCTSGPAAYQVPVERALTAVDRDVVMVRVGDVLVVRLDSNPSTGYGWAWDEAAAAGVLAQDGEPSTSGVVPVPGSGGVQTWRFHAVKTGTAELRLDYRRPWEKDQPPAQTVRWSVQVR